MEIQKMQDLNRDTIEYISKIIKPGMKLTKIRELCENYMLVHGADSFWYWNIGALIYAGKNTVLSVSGRNYKTDNYTIKSNDIITIDLSPQKEGIWGDYARTLVVENGIIVKNVDRIANDEWRNGIKMEKYLHNSMLGFVDENTTFEELYYYINDVIKFNGYENLDFNGNLGHSIVNDVNQRIYIEKGNKKRLSEVEAFTFEPHIRLFESSYGFKRENIYSFIDGKLVEI